MGCPICAYFKKRFSEVLREKSHEDYTKGEIFIGKGFKLKDVKEHELVDIHQKNENRGNHTFVFGGSGVGKSKFAEANLDKDIASGRNVVVIDPKGGGDMYSRMVQAAYKAGRHEDLMYCSPIFPQFSIKINPVSHFFMEEELINHVMAGVSTDNEFFYSAALELSTVIIKGLLIQRRYYGEDTPLTFEEIAGYVSYKKLKKLRDNLDRIDMTDAAYLVALADTLLSTSEEHFGKITPTLRVALTEMTSGNTGKIIGGAKENPFIDRIESGEGVILYVQTGAMLTNRTAGTIARVLTSMIQSTVGRHDSSGIKLQRPLCYYGDEFSNIAYRGVEDLFNKGRAAGVWITALTQSMADIVAELGDERARKLFDNTSTKLFMRINDYQSARLVAAYGGIKKKYSPMLSLNGGITNREVEDDVLRPEQILRLKKREFFYFGFEGEFKGKVARIGEPELRVQMPDAKSKGVAQ